MLTSFPKRSLLTLGVLVFLVHSAGLLCAQKTHRFTPKKFFYTYDARHEPVLKINPGDTLITTTRDAFSDRISRAD